MDPEEVALARKLKDWVAQQLDLEVARVEACGQKILRLPVKNCSVLRPTPGKVINRVEVDSALDFDCVEQILLSDPVPCPLQEKKGYSMVFVVLSTGKPIVLIMPYIYDTSVADNSLQEWHLINSKLKTSHHRVSGFSEACGMEAISEEAQEAQEPSGAARPRGRRVPARPPRKKR